MIRVRFVRASAARVRAMPVAEGAQPPRPDRAALAGFTGVAGESTELVGRTRRILLIGTGHEPDYEAAGALAVAKILRETRIALDARALTTDQAVHFAIGACLRAWRFDRLLSQPDLRSSVLTEIDVLVLDRKGARAAWAPAQAVMEGVWFARDLVTEPGNVLTPQGFATRLTRLEREGVQVEILDAAQLASEGFGCLLAVGAASVHPPCLAVLRWRGEGDGPPVVFVGKGVTFDTGGVCIKPGPGMWDMRADMAGAAACAGAMLSLSLRRARTPAVAVLPLVENAIGASAYRPGDVLRSHSGRTIEVVDTDAEGRLILADALSWAVTHLRPTAVIDLATLTGSIVTALGHERAGLFGDRSVGDALELAGEAVGELLWRMPVAAEHTEALRSDIADSRHCSTGKSQPDASIAAAFLRDFVGAVPWAHLDIAGMELRDMGPWYDPDRHALGATGYGVRLLDRFMASYG